MNTNDEQEYDDTPKREPDLFSCECCGHIGPQHHFQVCWAGDGDHWVCGDKKSCNERRSENGD